MWKIVLGLVVVVAILGWLLKQSYEANGALEIALTIQAAETEKAIAQIENLQTQHVLQIENYDLINKELQEDVVQHQQEVVRIRGLLESSQAAALREPERFGRIATFNLRRGLRGICRAGGGNKNDCEIEIPERVNTDAQP